MNTENKGAGQASGDNAQGDKININAGDNAKNVAVGKGNQIFNVESNNQTGGITGGIVNIGSQQRRISQALADDLVEELLKYPPEEYNTYSLSNDNEALQLTSFIELTLARAGWKRITETIVLSFEPPRGVILQSPVPKASLQLQILLQWMAHVGLKPNAGWVPNSEKILIVVGTNPN